jgi:hypothetical protein
MKLTDGQKHVLRLAKRDADENGWCFVSSTVFPFIETIPEDLLKKEKSEDGTGMVRLTANGETILRYS